ncbi:MAG: OmpA family protein [Bacteroidetes bacterium]|nr:OmpA family protein [Bacteroidota bacterium]
MVALFPSGYEKRCAIADGCLHALKVLNFTGVEHNLLWSLLLSIILWPGVSQAQQDEVRKSIYFDGGSFYIDEYQAADLAHWLDSIPNLLDKYEIQLISHTDPIGGRRFNEWLSRMRSTAVFNLLLEKDIPEKLIHVKDWGYENPVYANDSYEGMLMNRRVDVILRPVVF